MHITTTELMVGLIVGVLCGLVQPALSWIGERTRRREANQAITPGAAADSPQNPPERNDQPGVTPKTPGLKKESENRHE